MPIELNGIQREFPKLAHPSCSGLPNLLVFEGDDPEMKPNEQTKTTAFESRIKSLRRQRGDGQVFLRWKSNRRSRGVHQFCLLDKSLTRRVEGDFAIKEVFPQQLIAGARFIGGIKTSADEVRSGTYPKSSRDSSRNRCC